MTCNGLFIVVETEDDKTKEEEDDSFGRDSLLFSVDAQSASAFGNDVDKHEEKEEGEGLVCSKGSDKYPEKDDTTEELYLERHSEQNDNVCRSTIDTQKSVGSPDLKSGSYDSVMHS